MTKTIFITGTDTEIGKTYVSLSLINTFNKEGFSTFGIKLIASGCKIDANGSLLNEDALLLQKISTISKPYNVVNPIRFKEPIAPNIAANNTNTKLSSGFIKQKLLDSIQQDAELNLIEGIGGWAIPINNKILLANIISELQIPIILVVGIKLGCLNHSILTNHMISSMKIPFIGWIANCLNQETKEVNQNIQTLKNHIDAPCLDIIPYSQKNIIPQINISKINKFLF
ncbi:MAG: dethiobiotin synthase [Legionellales bacterium]|nr:dethiobiotin synthase [Legionellales bacterium]